MQALRTATLACSLLACGAQALAQADYRVYTEHPRLFLEPDRLTRLRKEVDRQSLRWRSLRDLADSGIRFPEQPLVDALRYRAEGSAAAGSRAVGWSVRLASSGISTAAELRQAALVYDWCRDRFEAGEREAVQDAIAGAVGSLLSQAGLEVGLVRAAILASIALAGDWDGSEPALDTLLNAHWDREVRPALESGGLTDDGAALVAVLETSLAVRHNLEIDLLRPATHALATLVRTRLLSYYPADVRTAEGTARRPSRFGPDERAAQAQAPLYRLGEMLLVAYESNLREFQFLQGWIRDDTYRLQSPLFAPYEFLWINPYLPGLTARSAPLLAYDPVRGRLYGRQSWDRPTTWIGFAEGRMEILSGGSLSATASFRDLPPMYFPEAAVVPIEAPGRVVLRWEAPSGEPPENASIFLLGLQPFETYGLKVGGREPRVVEAGAGGFIVLRTDPTTMKRDRIDLRKRVRIEVKPTLKPTDPRRPRPTLGR